MGSILSDYVMKAKYVLNNYVDTQNSKSHPSVKIGIHTLFSK